MVVKSGRIVLTPREAHPYKVILEHEGGGQSEHPVASVREGEKLIREKSPPAIRPDRLREWNPLV